MATASKNLNMKHRSKEITEGSHRAPARAMLWAMGLSQEDMDKPFVAIANLASDITPCNVHLDRFAQEAKDGVRQGDGTPFEFGTITVSDGISMGTEGMKASLVSREVIADSIEVVAFAERMDGLITIAGCDKNMPGCMMAMARLNIPSIFIYGGTIMPGRFQDRDVSIQDVFEAVGAYAKKDMSLDELRDLERHACPGEGSCAGLFTANTMSTAIEALGMSLPGDASIPATDPRKSELSRQAGQALMRLLAEDVRPRDILTPAGFRERHHRGRGHGRLHQRSPPPDGHRQRGRGRPQPAGLRPHQPEYPLHRRHEAGGPLRDGRPGPLRRRVPGNEAAAGGRPPPRRRHDRHREEHQEQRCGNSHRRRPTGGLHRGRARGAPPVAWPFSTATWPPTAQ